MTSLDHCDASLSILQYTLVRKHLHRFLAAWYIPELLTIIKIVDNTDVNRIKIKVKK